MIPLLYLDQDHSMQVIYTHGFPFLANNFNDIWDLVDVSDTNDPLKKRIPFLSHIKYITGLDRVEAFAIIFAVRSSQNVIFLLVVWIIKVLTT